MRSISALSLSSLVATVVLACGGEAPQPIVRPPPLVVKATPPAERAHWVFTSAERDLQGKLELGDGRTLYVGRNGRRVLALAKAAETQDAPVLALDDLAGVVRDDKGGFAFVATDGDIYRASEPLGTLGAPRPGPLGAERETDEDGDEHALLSIATGRAAVLAILRDGRVMRTADFGETWKAVDYAGSSKPFGSPVSIALDSKGNGVLVHLPQRLFVTHDDGLTWAPIASPNVGAARTLRDGADRVFLMGARGRAAKLEGQALVATTDEPEDVFRAPAAPPRPRGSHDETGERKVLLAGDHVVELQQLVRHGAVRDVLVSSTKLGDKPKEPVSVPDLAGVSSNLRVAAHGKTVVYLREDDVDDDDAATATTSLFASDDFGATWHKSATLRGVEPSGTSDIPVAAGPKGWAFVRALCPRDRSGDDECGRKQIRPAGAAAFEDLAFTEDFTLRDVAFDEAHDRVYAIGLHEGRKHVYESPLSQNKFARTKLLDASDYAAVEITVDPSGTLRVMEWDRLKDVWVLHRRTADGKEQPPLYIPLERGSVALAGGRGLLFSGHERGYETADGGETWMRVATNGFAYDLQCSNAGCVTNGAQRVGWDIPAVVDQRKVTAQTEVPEPHGHGGHVLPTPPLPKVQLTCKAAGAASTLTQMPSMDLVDDRTPEVRWASIKHEDDGRSTIVVANRTRVRELPLLGAEPKAKPGAGSTDQTRNGVRVLDDGVVVARYSFARRANRGAPLNPVDVDLAWWSAATGRAVHKSLPKVKPFRIGRFGFAGIPQIIDGGLLFQPQGREPAYFIHDDGKVESLTLPQDATVNEAERAGNRWLLADADYGEVELSWSDDGAKSWKQRTWGLGRRGEPSLTLLAGKPVIALRDAGKTLLFGVDANPPDDPPTPTVVESLPADTACDATASSARITSQIPYDRRSLYARIANADKTESELVAETRIRHFTASGKTCTAAYALTGQGRDGDRQAAYVYPEASGWSGWRFTRVEARGKGARTTWSAQPITCQGPN